MSGEQAVDWGAVIIGVMIALAFIMIVAAIVWFARDVRARGVSRRSVKTLFTRIFEAV